MKYKKEAAAAAKQEAAAVAKLEAAAREALMSSKAKAKTKSKSPTTSDTNYLLPSAINQTTVITQLGMAHGQQLLPPETERLFATLLSNLKIKMVSAQQKAERDQILIDMKIGYNSVYKRIKQPT